MSEGYEIDFLPVGKGKHSGDALALRWLMNGRYYVMVYDGGDQDAGRSLVRHIKEFYETDTVDFVVNSHPDNDHASGLSVVLEELNVKELWMHRPWQYSSEILHYFKDGRITDASLERRLKEKMSAAYRLEQLAIEKGITINEPFQGEQIGPFTVMSPERDWYVHDLVPKFTKTPELAPIDLLMDGVAAAMESVNEMAAYAADKNMIDSWDIEFLRENVKTSAENDSSCVLFGRIANRGILLTGDAGVQALQQCLDYAPFAGATFPADLNFIQIPHHGGRHNVSTKVLDELLGTKKSHDDGQTPFMAFVSASKLAPTHPKKMVTNAFIKRGAKVYATKGQSIRHARGMPKRNWSALTPIDFSELIEKW
ncbi:ComEC/Rec2 family competence protein [Pseudomonas sp. 18058]|uniref:ComEC/Rec2 family competence protein n=1 Tax=Pseudomonas sp. 18058 TaxID=2681406 RepID=UPI001357F2E5|nr:hypothetical protein [Pseudomonas sp. 18058]